MRRATLLSRSLLAACMLAACGGSNGEEGLPTDAGGAGGTSRTVALAPVDNSGITGTVTITEKGDSTTFVVTLQGGAPGAGYPAHVHERTCADAGPVSVALATVNMGQTGSGSSSTTTATKPLQDARARAGGLLVMAHFPNGLPAACTLI